MLLENALSTKSISSRKIDFHNKWGIYDVIVDLRRHQKLLKHGQG